MAGRNGNKQTLGEPKDSIDVAASFGQLSIGTGTARLSVNIDRGDLKSSKAENYLCGARCDVRLTIDPGAGEDVPGQTKLPGHDGESISSVVDIKSYRVSPDKFGTGLTFAIGEIDIEALSHFANSKGRMIAVRVGDAGSGEEDVEGDED